MFPVLGPIDDLHSSPSPCEDCIPARLPSPSVAVQLFPPFVPPDGRYLLFIQRFHLLHYCLKNFCPLFYYLQVLRSRMASAIDLLLLPFDTVTGTISPLIIGFSYSASTVVWIECCDGGRGTLFVLPTSPAPNLPCRHRFLLYPYCLLALGDRRGNYRLLANHLPAKGLCWSTLCRRHMGDNRWLLYWCLPSFILSGGREGSTLSLLPFPSILPCMVGWAFRSLLFPPVGPQ